MSVPTPTLSANPWLRILDALEKKINRHSYDTWLKPTRYSHSSNGIMYVRVPTAEFRHVGDKYADLIQEALDNLNMDYQDVEFVTPDDDPAATPVRHDGGLSAAHRLHRQLPHILFRKRVLIGTARRSSTPAIRLMRS